MVFRASATHTLSRLLSLTGGSLLVSPLVPPFLSPQKRQGHIDATAPKKRRLASHRLIYNLFFFLPYNRLLRTCINWKERKERNTFIHYKLLYLLYFIWKYWKFQLFKPQKKKPNEISSLTLSTKTYFIYLKFRRNLPISGPSRNLSNFASTRLRDLGKFSNCSKKKKRRYKKNHCSRKWCWHTSIPSQLLQENCVQHLRWSWSPTVDAMQSYSQTHTQRTQIPCCPWAQTFFFKSDSSPACWSCRIN